jgi:hypothetical protein
MTAIILKQIINSRPFTESPLAPYSHTPSVHFCFGVGDKFSYPNTVTSNVTVLYILMSRFLIMVQVKILK